MKPFLRILLTLVILAAVVWIPWLTWLFVDTNIYSFYAVQKNDPVGEQWVCGLFMILIFGCMGYMLFVIIILAIPEYIKWVKGK